MTDSNDVMVISQNEIENLIYTIRGQKVMLDSDLARIYGYETKNFNRQVRNIIERFDDDFMFELTKEEALRCKNFTLNEEGRGKCYFDLRNRLVFDGVIVDGIFEQDYEFNAPSADSAVIMGHTSNGNVDWKTSGGVKLKDLGV